MKQYKKKKIFSGILKKKQALKQNKNKLSNNSSKAYIYHRQKEMSLGKSNLKNYPACFVDNADSSYHLWLNGKTNKQMNNKTRPLRSLALQLPILVVGHAYYVQFSPWAQTPPRPVAFPASVHLSWCPSSWWKPYLFLTMKPFTVLKTVHAGQVLCM